MGQSVHFSQSPDEPLQEHGRGYVTIVVREMQVEHAQVFGDFDGRNRSADMRIFRVFVCL